MCIDTIGFRLMDDAFGHNMNKIIMYKVQTHTKTKKQQRKDGSVFYTEPQKNKKNTEERTISQTILDLNN